MRSAGKPGVRTWSHGAERTPSASTQVVHLQEPVGGDDLDVRRHGVQVGEHAVRVVLSQPGDERDVDPAAGQALADGGVRRGVRLPAHPDRQRQAGAARGAGVGLREIDGVPAAGAVLEDRGATRTAVERRTDRRVRERDGGRIHPDVPAPPARVQALELGAVGAGAVRPP